MYRYVDNDPVNYIDPSGHFAIFVPFLPAIGEAAIYLGGSLIAAAAGMLILDEINEHNPIPFPLGAVCEMSDIDDIDDHDDWCREVVGPQCRIQCTNETLPTPYTDYSGDAFFKCVKRCLTKWNC